MPCPNCAFPLLSAASVHHHNLEEAGNCRFDPDPLTHRMSFSLYCSFPPRTADLLLLFAQHCKSRRSSPLRLPTSPTPRWMMTCLTMMMRMREQQVSKLSARMSRARRTRTRTLQVRLLTAVYFVKPTCVLTSTHPQTTIVKVSRLFKSPTRRCHLSALLPTYFRRGGSLSVALLDPMHSMVRHWVCPT